MSDKKFEDLISGERKFLHDISNSLVVAQGMGGFVQRSIQKNDSISSKELERMDKAISAIVSMIELVRNRRDVINELKD